MSHTYGAANTDRDVIHLDAVLLADGRALFIACSAKSSLRVLGLSSGKSPETALQFVGYAITQFTEAGHEVSAVLTDGAPCFQSRMFTAAMVATGVEHLIGTCPRQHLAEKALRSLKPQLVQFLASTPSTVQ